MSLLDISKVTDTILNVIENGIKSLPDGDVPSNIKNNLQVVPDPPDKLSGNYTVGMYLYHIKENASNKNLPPLSQSQPAIRYTPMPLDLYYLLTAHSDVAEGGGTIIEQQLIGFSLKSLHDYPIVTKTTTIGGTPVMDPSISDGTNRLKIEMRPVDVDNATTYWTAGSSPQRLACYFMVSIVMLEPELPTNYASRVLTYHLSASPQVQFPSLESSGGIVTYTYPGESSKTLELRPAQATFGDTVTFEGNQLIGSKPTQFFFNHTSWSAPREIPSTGGWSLQVNASRVSLVLQETLSSENLMPGTYEGYALVSQRRNMEPSLQKDITLKSNVCAFLITPQLVSFTTISASTEITLTAKWLPYPNTSAEEVEIFVGQSALTMVPAGALNDGEFYVSANNTIKFSLPTGTSIGDVLTFRLLVNGVSTSPYWLKVV